MSDEELIERLDAACAASAAGQSRCCCIFRLGRPDVLAVDDYGVRKGFAKMHKLAELPKPKELLAYGERWRPYRSVASWYLWRAAEMKDLPMAGAEAEEGDGQAGEEEVRRKSPGPSIGPVKAKAERCARGVPVRAGQFEPTGPNKIRPRRKPWVRTS